MKSMVVRIILFLAVMIFILNISCSGNDKKDDVSDTENEKVDVDQKEGPDETPDGAEEVESDLSLEKDAVVDTAEPDDVVDNGPASEEDFAEVDADEIEESEDSAVPDADEEDDYLKIKDIQNPASAKHPAENDTVTLEKVIVMTKLTVDGKGFFISDIITEVEPYSGLYVYGDNLPSDLVPGELIKVTGRYYEYKGLSEIMDPEIERLGETAALPTPAYVPEPADIATAGGELAEQYESALVEVPELWIINDDPDPEDNDEFMVYGGLRVDDYLYDYVNPDMSVKYEKLVGHLYYDKNEFKLLPRDKSDMVEKID